MPPSWGANAILHPARRPVTRLPSVKFRNVDFDVGVNLKGWRFRAAGARRGTLVYLHGLSANRGSSAGIAKHFVERGFDVIAYDSRAHGESGGDVCTYGYYEKKDLARVLDTLDGAPVVLFGSSMGAAVALQTAAEDPRVSVVIAVSTISDLRTAAFERAPFFASKGNVEKALLLAEQQGKFRVAEVSPVALAPRMRAAAFLIHGSKDPETPPAHSQRVFQALGGPRKLLIVPGAGHNDAVTNEAWRQIDEWIEAHLAPAKDTAVAR
jgi:pimeloyl-ACP methyl ester carboxylesterase